MGAKPWILLGMMGAVAVGVAAVSGGEQNPPKVSPHNILHNALRTENGGPLDDLLQGALTSSAITNNPAIISALADPGTQKFFKYLIECALPETATVAVQVEGETVVFDGSGGLGAEWETGPCGEACQEWVSACLFARTNVYGVAVRIYMDGDHPQLIDESQTEVDPTYSMDEGAFYGNYFANPPKEYACRGAGNDPLYLSFRVCTRPGNKCGIQHVGPCGAIDGETGLPSKRHACELQDGKGNWQSCRNRPTLEGSDQFPDGSKVYRRVITIRLRKTSFSDGLRAEGCEAPDGGASDAGESPDSGHLPGTTAGARCSSDDECASDLLICDTRSPNPLCTTVCTQSPTPEVEEEQCGGPGSTCLAFGPGEGTCTRACRPRISGQCEAGRVCTGLWPGRPGGPDNRGCYPFCSRDSDCVADTRCNPRNGACGVAEDPAAQPDGTACFVDGPAVCKGSCFALVQTSSVGLCGSFINLLHGQRCPDEPDRITPIYPAAGDDLGLCVFKSCGTDRECQAPFKCLTGPAGNMVCTL